MTPATGLIVTDARSAGTSEKSTSRKSAGAGKMGKCGKIINTVATAERMPTYTIVFNFKFITNSPFIKTKILFFVAEEKLLPPWRLFLLSVLPLKA